MIVKLSELSGILGITPRQINKLAKAKIIPRARKGEYELSGAVQGYIFYIKDGDADKKTTLHDQEIKLKKAQTRKLELEIEKMEGVLIPVTEMQKLWERHIIAARTNFLLIENEIPRIRASKDNTDGETIFRRSAYAILDQLAKAEIIRGDEEPDSDDAETLAPASDVKRKRVGRRKDVVKP